MLQSMKTCALAILGAILLAGCAGGPTSNDLKVANYGAKQSPEQCAAIAEAQIRLLLKDPHNAVFFHVPCSKGWMKSVPIFDIPVEFGYIQSGFVNERNSFGVYVGPKPYRVVIRDGKVVHYCITQGIIKVCIPTRPLR